MTERQYHESAVEPACTYEEALWTLALEEVIISSIGNFPRLGEIEVHLNSDFSIIG